MATNNQILLDTPPLRPSNGTESSKSIRRRLEKSPNRQNITEVILF